MKTAIVTTTIYRPDNLAFWAESLQPDDVIIVAGDRKTPHGQVVALLGELATKFNIAVSYVLDGADVDWTIGERIGWNTIQRRNIAILEAMTYDPDTVITVDTDNFPVRPRTHVTEVNSVLHVDYAELLTATDSGWFNVGKVLDPPVTHRGYPLSRRRGQSQENVLLHATPTHVGVHTSLWYGDPDVDAIERIHSDPLIRTSDEQQVVLAKSTWCPFNSQATAWRRELLPLLNVWPYVGRMDDIWSSYVARRVMDHLNYHVAYGTPYVVQERHPHDLVRDLENELIGYRHTDEFAKRVRLTDLGELTDPLDCFDAVTTQIRDLPFISQDLRAFWRAWINDVHTAREVIAKGVRK